jgi:DNA replication factor GINS
MDLDELRSAQSRERQASQLQHLRDGFYEEAASFIRGLRTERERAAANTDYSFPYDDPEVQRLTNEIQTAEEVVESLYERRVGKVVKMASFEAAGMAVDAEGLTAEESDLFETLVGDIEANRGRVLDALAGTSGDGAGPGTSTDTAPGTADGSATPGGAPTEADRADAPATGGDREPEARAAEDEPVHIGSGPAADGPVSTADEDARSETASPPGQAPTPGTENREAAGSEPETAPDSARPAPSRESDGRCRRRRSRRCGARWARRTRRRRPRRRALRGRAPVRDAGGTRARRGRGYGSDAGDGVRDCRRRDG